MSGSEVVLYYPKKRPSIHLSPTQKEALLAFLDYAKGVLPIGRTINLGTLRQLHSKGLIEERRPNALARGLRHPAAYWLTPDGMRSALALGRERE